MASTNRSNQKYFTICHQLMPKSLLPVVKNKTGNSVNHHSYQQSTIIWLAINKGKWKRHQCVRGRSFREFFQMLLLKSTADMINFFFFFPKGSFLLQTWFFFKPEHDNFNKVCQKKIHCTGWSRQDHEICDRLRISHTKT